MIRVIRSTATNSWSPRVSTSHQVIRSTSTHEWPINTQPSYISRIPVISRADYKPSMPAYPAVIRTAHNLQPASYRVAAHDLQPASYRVIRVTAHEVQPSSYRAAFANADRPRVYSENLYPASYVKPKIEERLYPASYVQPKTEKTQERTVVHHNSGVSLGTEVYTSEYMNNGIPDPSSSDNDDISSVMSFDSVCTPPTELGDTTTSQASSVRTPPVLNLFSAGGFSSEIAAKQTTNAEDLPITSATSISLSRTK